MLKVVTGKEMARIDHYTIHSFGLPAMVLMERAALSVVEELLTIKGIEQKKLLILCGTGNNGGDGLAIARMLRDKGICVSVLIVGATDKFTDEAKRQYHMVRQLGIEIINKEASIDDYHLYVDAIFGTGLSRPITGKLYTLIEKINQSQKPIYAVDIPSGIASDTGKIQGIAVKATKTITFGCLKRGLLLYPGANYVGKVVVKDIGFPKISYQQIQSKVWAYEPSDVLRLLPIRQPQSHKGSYGKVLIIAGNEGMSGAAYLSAKAAYRIGAGLVKILSHRENQRILQTNLPEAIFSAFEIGPQGELENVSSIINDILWADVIVIGPGLGEDKKTQMLLKILLDKGKVPMLIDADGLNVLARHLDWLKGHQSPIIITPHPGEMARLIQKKTKEVVDDLWEIAKTFSEEYQVICVQKDARTLVMSPSSEAYINLSGNEGMATAGAGDVLTGIIAGLIGQGCMPYEASCLGVYIHGLAGDHIRHTLGTYSMMASDIIDALSVIVAH